MTKHNHFSADSNYGLATPPTSPTRQNANDLFWPRRPVDSAITRSSTKIDNIVNSEKAAVDFNNLTPPASPIKQKLILQTETI